MDICPKCGLPKQACVCEGIAKSDERIKVTTEKRKFGKLITLVTGLSKDVDVKEVARMLKNKLACGGTIKDGKIELQGEHLKKVKPILIELGFPGNAVED